VLVTFTGNVAHMVKMRSMYKILVIKHKEVESENVCNMRV